MRSVQVAYKSNIQLLRTHKRLTLKNILTVFLKKMETHNKLKLTSCAWLQIGKLQIRDKYFILLIYEVISN
jgi:hypothetical protein